MFHLEQQLAYISKINNYLFLSSMEGIADEKKIAELNVTYIISVLQTPIKIPHNNVRHLLISIPDSAEVNIICYFNQVFSFIEDARKNNTNVLVHCEKGMSRSASFVIAWLMYEKHCQGQRVNYQNILHLVQQERVIVSPNPGFTKQLKNFEKQLNKNLPQYSLDTLSKIMEYLDPESLIKTHSTSRFFNNFFQNSKLWKKYLQQFFNINNEGITFFENQKHCSLKEIFQMYTTFDKIPLPNKQLSTFVGFSGKKNLCDTFLVTSGDTLKTRASFVIGAIYGNKNDLAKKYFSSLDVLTQNAILPYVVSLNNVSFIDYLYSNYPQLDWHQKNDHGNNLLFLAAYYGCYNCFVYLYEKIQINANENNNARANLLESLCYTQNNQLIQYVKNNLNFLDPYQPNHSQLTPYVLAQRKNNLLLLQTFNNWKNPESKKSDFSSNVA